MNDTENRKHATYVRVRGFGEAHADDFAANSLGKQFFASFAAMITELEGHAASEVASIGSERQGTSTRRQAREALRADLEAINRTARAMALDVVGIEDKFRVPYNNNDHHLLSAARAAATDALPLKAQFIAHEMPADFLEDLNADIAALEAAISNQNDGLVGHVSAGAAIDDVIERLDEMLDKLDAMVKNKYANDPSVLAQWASASHTERTPRRTRIATPPTPPPPA